jgi:hypothetical protein
VSDKAGCDKAGMNGYVASFWCTQHEDRLRRHEQLCLRTKLPRQRLRSHLQWRWFLPTEPGGRRDQHGAELLRNEVLRGPYQLWGIRSHLPGILLGESVVRRRNLVHGNLAGHVVHWRGILRRRDLPQRGGLQLNQRSRFEEWGIDEIHRGGRARGSTETPALQELQRFLNPIPRRRTP